MLRKRGLFCVGGWLKILARQNVISLNLINGLGAGPAKLILRVNLGRGCVGPILAVVVKGLRGRLRRRRSGNISISQGPKPLTTRAKIGP